MYGEEGFGFGRGPRPTRAPGGGRPEVPAPTGPPTPLFGPNSPRFDPYGRPMDRGSGANAEPIGAMAERMRGGRAFGGMGPIRGFGGGYGGGGGGYGGGGGGDGVGGGGADWPPPLSNNQGGDMGWSQGFASQAKPNSEPIFVIRMRGIPFSATQQDIKDFFSPLETTAVEVGMEASGRPSGEARVKFSSKEQVKEAMKLDRKNLGSRYVELFDESTSGAGAGMAKGTWNDGSSWVKGPTLGDGSFQNPGSAGDENGDTMEGAPGYWSPDGQWIWSASKPSSGADAFRGWNGNGGDTASSVFGFAATKF